jgi:hypothetical protein
MTMDQQEAPTRPAPAADAIGRRRSVAPVSRLGGALGAPRRALQRARATAVAGWDLLRAERVLQIAVAMIVAQLAYRTWATSLSWYTLDDFAFMSRTLNDGIAPSVLFEPYAGHVMPAAMFLSWLSSMIAPYNFVPTAVIILAMQAIANVGLLMLLVRWFGIRRGILPPLALYLFCVISFPVAIWWAAAANQIPLQIVLFFALQTHLTYLQTGRIRHAWFTVAWLLGGFLFYEKTVFVLGAIAIISLAYFATGSILERLRSLWDRFRAGMVLYIVVGATYLFIYYRTALNFDPGDATKGGLPDVVANMVFHVYLPALVGGPLKWDAFDQFSLPATGALAIVLSVVLVALAVREIQRTHRRSLRAWWLPVFFLSCNIVLVLAGRASFVGALIAMDFRYQGELAAVTALALACATMPIRGALEPVERNDTPSGFLDRPRRVAAVVVVCSLLATVSATQYIQRWNEYMPGKPYFDNLVGGIEASNHPYPMVDQQVPNTIMWGLGYPLNLQSHLLKPYTDRDQVRFVSSSIDELRISTPDGKIWPAAIPLVRSAPPGPDDCGYRITSKQQSIALDGPLAFGGWWARVAYFSEGPSTVHATVGDADYDLDLPAGLHSLYLEAGGNFDSVEMSRDGAPGRMCVNEVVIGRPEAVEVPDDGS